MVVAAVACGSSPPTVASQEGADSGPHPHAEAGPSPGIDATAPGPDAADAGSPADVVVAVDAPAVDAAKVEAGPRDAGPPVCKLDGSIGSTASFVLGTPDPDLLGAVTPDELVIAWTSLPEDGGPAVHWAERAVPGDPFGAVQTLDPSFGPFPSDHVALSGDGLRIAFSTPDQTQMVEVSRAARGTAFATVTTATDFAGVNPTGGPEGDPGIGPFFSPALSPDFGIWTYNQGGNGLVLSFAGLSGEWSTPPSFPGGLVPPSSSPTTIFSTGWSTDRRTMFYWDSSSQFEVIAWLEPFTYTFVLNRILGTTEQYAYPSGDCTKIYYSAASPDDAGAGLDIYVAPWQ